MTATIITLTTRTLTTKTLATMEPQATRRPRLGKSSKVSGTRGARRLLHAVERSRLPPKAGAGKRDSLIGAIGSGKLLIVACCALLVCLPAVAEELPMLINHGVDGSWTNSKTTSQGVVIETVPSSNSLVAFWFTYSEAGGQREWYIGVGDINGAEAELIVYRVENGVFDQASATEEEEWGTARIKFSDCTHAQFDYESPMQGVDGSFSLERLLEDVSCAATLEQTHVTFVSRSNVWLDARGTWVFDGCVKLGPAESHGREEIRFGGATLSFDIDHFGTANCSGPVDVQSMSFDLIRLDKIEASLEGGKVIANRVLLQDKTSGELFRQILYFNSSADPNEMTHGKFDGALDAAGYPNELHDLLFFRQP